jgi:Escherichia/Staphylococcus phage prohead protease
VADVRGGRRTGSRPSPGRATRGGLRFAGYAAIFGRPDRGGDVVRQGAFARTLRGRAAVPLLWQHRPGRAIGRIDYLKEDRRGLRVIGQLFDGGAAALLEAGRVSGLSFGYRVRRAEGEAPRALIELDLVEISLVTRPMQPKARVHAIETCAKIAA